MNIKVAAFTVSEKSINNYIRIKYGIYTVIRIFTFLVACWERADLLALVCGVYCEFVTFPLVSWVRCGT